MTTNSQLSIQIAKLSHDIDRKLGAGTGWHSKSYSLRDLACERTAISTTVGEKVVSWVIRAPPLDDAQCSPVLRVVDWYAILNLPSNVSDLRSEIAAYARECRLYFLEGRFRSRIIPEQPLVHTESVVELNPDADIAVARLTHPPVAGASQERNEALAGSAVDVFIVQVGDCDAWQH
jgi:hypothetical protein